MEAGGEGELCLTTIRDPISHFHRDDFFADKDICSIVLEVPNSALGSRSPVGLWHRTLIASGDAGGGWTQVDRQARVQQENFVCPNEMKVEYLAAEPADDAQLLDAIARSLEHTGGYSAEEARTCSPLIPMSGRHIGRPQSSNSVHLLVDKPRGDSSPPRRG